MAKLLCQEIRAALQLPDWPPGTGGVVTPFQASGEERRGQRSVTSGRAPATLIEPFFGSHRGDCEVAQANKDALAQAIVAAVRRF